MALFENDNQFHARELLIVINDARGVCGKFMPSNPFVSCSGGWLVLYRRFQNSKDFPSRKVGHAKIFNFSLRACKLLNSISRDSGDSPDSNHTKYVNYECLHLKEIGVIFPSL